MTRHEAVEILEEVKMIDDSMFAYSQAYNDALDMAIETLKAQEPVEPKKKSFLVSGPDDYTSTPAITVCGACDAWLLTVAPRAKYCPQCGRAVKWE